MFASYSLCGRTLLGAARGRKELDLETGCILLEPDIVQVVRARRPMCAALLPKRCAMPTSWTLDEVRGRSTAQLGVGLKENAPSTVKC